MCVCLREESWTQVIPYTAKHSRDKTFVVSIFCSTANVLHQIVNNRHSLSKEAATTKVFREYSFSILIAEVFPLECFAVSKLGRS